jgi:hypothetical protein
MVNFGKDVTTSGAGWFNILTLMQALAWTGGSDADEFTFSETAGQDVRLKTGHDSNITAPVSGTDGVSMTNKDETMRCVELSRAWVHTDAARTFSLRVTSPTGR